MAAAAGDPPRERIFLSKESMAKVRDAVALDKVLPPNATRDELRAYNKLASELTEQTIKWRLEMEKQQWEDLDKKNSRRPPPRHEYADHDPLVRNKSKLSNLRRTDKKRVVRKLDDDFKLEETDDEKEPLTPA